MSVIARRRLARSVVVWSPERRHNYRQRLITAATGSAVVGVALGMTYVLTSRPLWLAFAVCFVPLASIWMATTERYEVALGAILLYLALADGYIKLKTNAPAATLGRDLLLYALVVGAIVRWLVRSRNVETPPMVGWVIAFVGAVLLQLLNPANTTIAGSLAGLRPHVEWVPLFFLGYLVMRSKRRLRGFFVLLLAVTAINAGVGFVQAGLTPEQFASWGPGYQERVFGEGAFVGADRTYADANDELRVRPFGLGSDIGFSGALAALAIPAGMALLLGSGVRLRLAAAVLIAVAASALLTSQGRLSVSQAVAGIVAFALLAGGARQTRAALTTVAIGAAVCFVAISVVANDQSGTYDRYHGQGLQQGLDIRKDNLQVIPTYLEEYPFGAGIGQTGPASGFAAGQQANVTLKSEALLNAENEISYLVVEVGILGLLILGSFNVLLLARSLRRLPRIDDPDVRFMLAALSAGIFSLFAVWLAAPTTANTPGAPFLWFAAGTLAFWLGRPTQSPSPSPAQSVDLPTSPTILTR
jgi:hypothetical protein